MSVTLKELLKSNAQNRVYKKENEKAIVEFRDTIIDDLRSTLMDAKAMKKSAESIISDEIHSDEFVMGKVNEELEYIDNCIKQLAQLSEKPPKEYRLVELHKAYKRIVKTYRSMRTIKEYVHRIREDNILYMMNQNSQQS